MGKQEQAALPGLNINKPKAKKGRLSRSVDSVISQSKRTGGPYVIDDLTAAMLRTAALNVEAAILEGSSWAVANALKELRAVRDEVVQPQGLTDGDAFDQLLQDLASDIPAPGSSPA